MRLIPLFNAILRSVLNANGNRITNVGEPTEDNDAATKKYVSDHAGEPADYSTVRDNAATGAAHAAKHGSDVVTDENPHGTMAGQILMSDMQTVEGAIHSTNLALSGVASTAANAELVSTGAANLVIAHENNTNNPHATTAEQVGAYTKTEVDEKVGGRQEKLTDEQLANIDDVPNKLNGPTDTSLTTSGAAADAKAVGDRIERIERTANPNMNVVGNPVFKEGNVSGFSATDYMVFPSSVSVGQHSVVFDLAFQTGANVTTQQNILDSNKGLAFAIRSGKFVTAISTDGASWYGESVGGDVGANTAYKVRMTFAYVGAKYEAKTFVEVGGAFVEIGTGFSTDAPVHATTTYWGGANPQGTAHVFGGSINLNECRLSFDGEEVWTGYDVLARNIVTFDQTKPSAEQLSTAEKILAAATKLMPLKNAAGEIVGYTIGGKTTPVLITSDALSAGVFVTPAFKTAVSYSLNDANENGIIDRAINETTSATFVIPKDFTDLIVRFNGTPVSIDWATKETGITDVRGDDLPSESGDYLITFTRTKATEAFVKVLNIAKE